MGWYMWLSKLSIWPSSESFISAVPYQNFMKFFLVTLLWQKSIWYFMVHVWAPHQFWENEHGQNHGNPKMPLSLASSSDVAGILVPIKADNLWNQYLSTVELCLHVNLCFPWYFWFCKDIFAWRYALVGNKFSEKGWGRQSLKYDFKWVAQLFLERFRDKNLLK